MKACTRTRNRRVFQLEALEGRLTLSAASGGLEAVVRPLPAEQGAAAAQVQGLQDRGEGVQSLQSRGENARRARVNRGIAGLDRANDNLEQAIVRLERAESFGDRAAASRALNRGLAGSTRALAQLSRALGTRVTEADRTAVLRPIGDLNRLQARAQEVLSGTIV